MDTTHRFEATIETEPGDDNTFIVVPFDVPEAFGTRGRVPVQVEINGALLRASLSPYAGKHYLGLSKAMRAEAGVQAGERVAVALRRDDEPRTIAPPEDLAAAMQASHAARAGWELLSYTKRKDIVLAVEAAKKPETRQRRIQKALAELEEKARGAPGGE